MNLIKLILHHYIRSSPCGESLLTWANYYEKVMPLTHLVLRTWKSERYVNPCLQQFFPFGKIFPQMSEFNKYEL